ncbi:MAG: hypothetical protein KAS96_08490 [Planctomycetes bacterium]|nr:hypothetical protein [Planctomycetota bacterium]
MKKFAWRLQRLLDIKNIEEKCKTMELAKVTKILEETEMMIIKHKRMLEQIISEISQKNTDDRLRIQEFFMKYSSGSDEIIKKLIQKMAELQDKRKKKLEELIEVKRYREGLEKLREQAKTKFTQEQEKQYQKQLDDDAGMRIARKILVKN